MKKAIFLILIIGSVAGCVKSTIDLDKVSGRIGFEPSFVIAAVKGDVTLGDLVEPDDTDIIFDDNGLMTIIFREDSVINYGVSDFYSSFPAGTYAETFPVTSTVEVEVDDVINIDPGSDVELKEMSVITGSVAYTATSTCTFSTMLRVEFPSIDDGGVPLVDTIYLPASGSESGEIIIDNVLIDLTTDPVQQVNRLPVNFRIIPAGGGTEPPGVVTLDISMEEPEFDYIIGYFGTQTEQAENDTLKLEMEDLFSKITGSFYISNPKITVNYQNSFGIPMAITADVTARSYSGGEETLNRDPENLLYPTTLTTRNVESSFIIDKNNSELPDLVSMLPDEIIFGGSASANPLGDTGTDNIIFGDSRFIASLEVEVPMEFWINNLQLTDTVDSFLAPDENGDSPLEMLSSLELRMFIDNGFPLGGSFSITLYDSVNALPMSVLSTDSFFDPAPVDLSGVVTGSVEKTTSLVLTEEFIEDSKVADKMIISFTLFTTGNGSQDVKIYSDYNIKFKAGLMVKAAVDTF